MESSRVYKFINKTEFKQPEATRKDNAIACKKYRRKMTEAQKEKKRIRQRKWNEKNKLRLAELARSYRRAYPADRILKASKQSAKKKGLEHSIMVADLLPLPEFCPVFGFKLDYNLSKFGETSPSIDRINNEKGYVKGNIVIVSWKANALKKNGTIQDFQRLIDFYKGLSNGV